MAGRLLDFSPGSAGIDVVEGEEVKFYLGTHIPTWLKRTEIPLFVSRRTLSKYRTPPRSIGGWALDSGGFTELSQFGKWETPPGVYIEEVYRWRDRVGGLAWAAQQDWMCEPVMLAKTGKTVREHQKLSTDNYFTLMKFSGDLPWVPVLQGWTPDDYLRHAEDYTRAGIDLASLPLVGVGTMCRRQAMEVALEILRPLHAMGLKLHGFGFKIDGLWRGASALLESADSMAWSKAARYMPPLEGCTHANCANCMKWALLWREEVLAAVERGVREYQDVLFY